MNTRTMTLTKIAATKIGTATGTLYTESFVVILYRKLNIFYNKISRQKYPDTVLNGLVSV
jgi:hypothetical protein